MLHQVTGYDATENHYDPNHRKHRRAILHILPTRLDGHGHEVPACGNTLRERFFSSLHQQLEGILHSDSSSSEGRGDRKLIAPPLALRLRNHLPDAVCDTLDICRPALHEQRQELVFRPATYRVGGTQTILNGLGNYSKHGGYHARATRRANLVQLIDLHE